jgi:hypothetical protein
MPSSYVRVFSRESCSLPGSLEASYQIPHAHVFFVQAPAHIGAADEVRSSSFVQQHVGKGKRPSAVVASEGGASFRVPVLFAAEEDQALPAPASEHRTVRAKDIPFGNRIGLHRVPLSSSFLNGSTARWKLSFCSRTRFACLRGAHKVKRALLDAACGRPVVLRQVHVEVKSKVKVLLNARFTPGTPCGSSVQHIVHDLWRSIRQLCRKRFAAQRMGQVASKQCVFEREQGRSVTWKPSCAESLRPLTAQALGLAG